MLPTVGMYCKIQANAWHEKPKIASGKELGTKVQRNRDRAAALGKWQFMFSILIC